MSTVAEQFTLAAWSAIADDFLFPRSLDAIFGIQPSTSTIPPLDVYAVWSRFIKYGLLTPREVMDALRAKSLKNLFVASVKVYAATNKPLWSPVGPAVSLLAHGEEQLEKLNFDTSYDPDSAGIDVTFPGHFQSLEDLESPGGTLLDLCKEKQEGNAHFQAGRLDEALECYDQALACAGEEPFAVQIRPQVAIVYSNIAQCYIRQERWSEARRAASTACKFDPTNEKAKARHEAASAKLVSILEDKDKARRMDDMKQQCGQQ